MKGHKLSFIRGGGSSVSDHWSLMIVVTTVVPSLHGAMFALGGHLTKDLGLLPLAPPPVMAGATGPMEGT